MISTTILMYCLSGKGADADPTFYGSLILSVANLLLDARHLRSRHTQVNRQILARRKKTIKIITWK